MSTVAIARSSLLTSLARYRRSWGIWILLLIAPIGARFFIPRGDGSAIVIAIGGHLPVMTSPVIGVCLGIVVTTLMLPAAYIFLRANTNRRQPWQVEEVSPAPRVAIALGRFAADAAVLLATLLALNVAGIFLAGLILPAGTLNPAALSMALWVIAAPSLMGLAALRILFDAVPALRGALGDFAYFVVWMSGLVVPLAMAGATPGFLTSMYDFGGFVQPLAQGADVARFDLSIGGGDVKPGRIAIDAMAGLFSPGYLPSRLAWAGIAIAVAALAGFVYRPHRVRRQRASSARLERLLSAGAPPPADPLAPPARPLRRPAIGLVLAEARLIGAGRLFAIAAAGVAVAGLVVDFTHAAVPALLLLMVFALTRHAGCTEATGLRALTNTTATSPWLRRAAFVTAGAGWTALIALPHAVAALDPIALGSAAALGTIMAATAILLAAISGSGFAPRIVLLIAWYGYTAS